MRAPSPRCENRSLLPTRDEMLQAIQARDDSLAGRFVFGVTTTGVVCRPGCPSRLPREENVRFFRDLDEAVSQGFRPCKRCRPDLPGGIADDDAALVARVQGIVAQDPAMSVARLGAAVGVNAQHLSRVFQRHAGQSLAQYLRTKRALRAAELLHGDLSLLDVGESAGFGSQSAFYAAFRDVTGQTPGEFRRRSGGGHS